MFKDYLNKEAITKFLDKIRIGGFTTNSQLKDNRQNTARILLDLWERSVKGEVPADSFINNLSKAIKMRKYHTLNNLRNIMSAIRGEGRNIISKTQPKGKWYNRGVLDGGTTHVCAKYIGRSWDIPYSQIENKPPRISELYHPCRSSLDYVIDGSVIDDRDFMTQFNGDESLQRELLGKTKYESYKNGSITIKSFKDYERIVLTTTEELGI